ncbi:hypothetical protein NDU88_001973 [Pleurodeles waltl]|uniref:Uncharacterized protein n=1 Tax=Pleurodeles waltl TaxID=8319 RepID=A0AAV7VDF9_PLEWA|nr:hypothetical protein NDU88_001973 [Pleurodeles waltl]
MLPKGCTVFLAERSQEFRDLVAKIPFKPGRTTILCVSILRGRHGGQKGERKPHHAETDEPDDLVEVEILHVLCRFTFDTALAEPTNKRLGNQEDDSEEDQKCKCIQETHLRELLIHIRETLGFQAKAQQEEGFYSQWTSDRTDDFRHGVIKDIFTKESKVPDKSSITRFLNKHYLIQKFDQGYPPNPEVNTILASLASMSNFGIRRRCPVGCGG